MHQPNTSLAFNGPDSLDEHLDELEVPGGNILQAIIAGGSTSSPVTTYPQYSTPTESNGYTSEESEYSNFAPTPVKLESIKSNSELTEEQLYQDMSFLSDINTKDLVDAVASIPQDNLTEFNSSQERKLENKILKGKTSKYRGVTKTSNSSWGAKYNANRIINTCNTPEEAAKAYDEHLKEYYPQKYLKFANFCSNCGQFLNPLNLPEHNSECTCYHSPPSRGTTSGDNYSVETQYTNFGGKTVLPGFSKTTSPSDVQEWPMQEHSPEQQNFNAMQSIPLDSNRGRSGSNLSIGSFGLSFLDSVDVGGQPLALSNDHGMYSNGNEMSMSNSRVIIGDQTNFSPPLLKQGSGGSLSITPNNLFPLDSNHSNMNAAKFTPEELQRLSNYWNPEQQEIYHDNSLARRQVQGTTHSLDFSIEDENQNESTTIAQSRQAKKMHSLDFSDEGDGSRNSFRRLHSLEMYDNSTGGTGSDRGSFLRQQNANLDDQDLVSAMDIDAFAEMMYPIPNQNIAGDSSSEASSSLPTIVSIRTSFLPKYWRNDRKNIQCFPYCPEHGDYELVRMNNLTHKGKGVCRAPVECHISIPLQLSLPIHHSQDILILGRCNSTFSNDDAYTNKSVLSMEEMNELQRVSAVGMVKTFESSANGYRELDVLFYPDVWKFEFDLPKKRKHGNGEDDQGMGGRYSMENNYYFEIDVFYSQGQSSFLRLAHKKSDYFQLGNTRTLLRARNKMLENDSNAAGQHTQDFTTSGDVDHVLNFGDFPEKKKIKMHYGQKGRSTITDVIDHIDSEDSANAEDHESHKIPILKNPISQSDASSTYNIYESPKSEINSANTERWNNAVPTRTIADRIPENKDEQQQNIQTPISEQESTTNSSQLPHLLVYGLASVLVSAVLCLLGILLLVIYIVIPPSNYSIVKVLDVLADMELRRANKTVRNRKESRHELKRIAKEQSNYESRGCCYYYTNGEAWSRLLYFAGLKFFISIFVLIPALILGFLAVVTLPIRSISCKFSDGACYFILFSRNYTQKVMGKQICTANVTTPVADMA